MCRVVEEIMNILRAIARNGGRVTGLEFQDGMVGFVPKILKSPQKESRGRGTPALEKFTIFLTYSVLYNVNFSF